MLHVELLTEGGYLATAEALQGLIAQGRTFAETLEIARDVAHQLLEAQQKRRPIFVDQPAQYLAWMTGHPV